MMSLDHLNRRLRLWTRTLTGQFGVLLLLAALIPGARLAVEHAHADGGQAHGHSTHLTADQATETETGLAGGQELHEHDLGTTASDLPPPVSLHAVSLASDLPGKGLIVSLPPSSPRSPPHRPPIA